MNVSSLDTTACSSQSMPREWVMSLVIDSELSLVGAEAEASRDFFPSLSLSLKNFSFLLPRENTPDLW